MTIESVVRQTVLPVEWVVVSDGSTDRTEAIVSEATANHAWIRLLALKPRAERNFAAVVHATEAGIKSLRTTVYSYIGLLDSDVRFESNYFDELIRCFELSPKLGLAGGMVIDLGLPRDILPRNRLDVPGAAQLFRRECFEALGGLVAIPEGGWDTLTCARARMLGYETRLVTDLVMDHLKPRNVAEGGVLRRLWQMGVRDYALGYHPIFELLKIMGRVSESPIVLGSIARWVGYCGAALQRRERLIPKDILTHVRKEQKARILEATGIRCQATEAR